MATVLQQARHAAKKWQSNLSVKAKRFKALSVLPAKRPPLVSNALLTPCARAPALRAKA